MVRPNPCRSFYSCQCALMQRGHPPCRNVPAASTVALPACTIRTDDSQSVLVRGADRKTNSNAYAPHEHPSHAVKKGIQVFEVGAHISRTFFQRQRPRAIRPSREKIDFVEVHGRPLCAALPILMPSIRVLLEQPWRFAGERPVAVCKQVILMRRFKWRPRFRAGVT